MPSKIFVKGARENNLKNIDVEIPRDALTVITGLSGSGKSSLAFDTIYAEGQRRYVESLSSYARMFLGQMEKPDIDSIADPAERKRRILLKQFYVSGIIGTFHAALSGSIMTTPTEIGHFVSEELLPRIAPHMQMPSQSETAQQPAASPQAQ